MTTDTIRAQVNEKNLINTLKYTFESANSLLSELAQNSRRAGATRVDFTYEDGVLTCTDDGEGIDDFAKLIHIAESGWDGETQAEEQPWGMGFLVCVHSCDRIRIESRGRYIDTDTAAILNFEDVAVGHCPDSDKTVIRMEGVKLDRIDYAHRGFFRAFPLPVTINGEDADRPHAVDDGFIDTPIGKVHFDKPCLGYEAFLQGFKVAEEGCLTGRAIIHLDSTKFRGKAPDRSKLVDAIENKAVINEALMTMMREHLQSNAGDAEYILKYSEVVYRLGMIELFNTIDVLPEKCLHRPSFDLLAQGDHSHGFGTVGADGLKRETVEAVKLVISDSFVDEYSPEEDTEMKVAINKLAYLIEVDGLLVQTKYLHKDHWLFSLDNYHDDLEVSMTPIGSAGADHSDWLEGYDEQEVYFCQSVELESVSGKVVSNDAVGLDELNNILYISEGADLREVTLMFSGYQSEFDHYEESYHDSVIDELEMRRTIALGRDITSVIKTILNENSSIRGVLLKGRNFQVSVSEEGRFEVSEAA